jgi:hypothetical protein
VLIRGERHLDRVLREFVFHYNRERPHRGTNLAGPLLDRAAVPEPGRCRASRPSRWAAPRVQRRRLTLRPIRPTPSRGGPRWSSPFGPSGTSLPHDPRRCQRSRQDISPSQAAKSRACTLQAVTRSLPASSTGR